MVFRNLIALFASFLLLLPEASLAQEGAPGAGLEVTGVGAEPPPPQVPPVILRIPALGVQADVFPVGEDAEGAMDVPPTPDSVAWWSLGAGTGVPGNVVLAGHVDWAGQLRVFGGLRRLGPGDDVIVVDQELREFHYQVVSNEAVPADGAAVDQIFANSDVPELTLITCGGEFDRASRQYLDRIIVRAVQV